MHGHFDRTYWLTKDGLYPRAVEAIICRLTSDEIPDTVFPDTLVPRTCPKGATTLSAVAFSLLATAALLAF